jgi:sterol 3beta-glucosyltransferase
MLNHQRINTENYKRIVVASLGSIGDGLPFLALGIGLKQAGHDIYVATAENYESRVIGQGLGFIPIRCDIKETLSSPEARKYFKSKNPITAVSRMKKLAAELGRSIKKEDGMAKAIEIIHQQLEIKDVSRPNTK